VPVLYHDFIVSETGLDIGVNNLTLKQFLDLRKNSAQQRHSTRDDAFIRSNTLRRSSLEVGMYSNNLDEEKVKRIIESPFATLCEAFRKVPADIGFNVEVKYPTPDEFQILDLYKVFEINEYCDKILAVAFEEANDRSLIFSSFHPDVVISTFS
jgi:glycerophosphoryl diester phosphodiesterase